ncbi:mechanosensitive ion channel family protein [Putridiphycobacter roseus]|uniref:Mechanosensitive ion channel family protein n=2 Tax=Putridiphycobacter roseus TaxID=2219161 RepID=A0A2W1N544_9FLAO|nr:mechanosensitive ion channel family protein [Putridiphycobacter roseus]
MDWWFDKLVEYGSSLLAGVLILVVGLFIVKRITKFIAKLVAKKDFDPSLSKFLVSLISVTLKVLVVITAMGQLGIEMTSFVALIGAAGLAIGMAFSGTLGNLAGGVMILIFRPYKIGDFMQGQGEMGTVKEIGIFNTILLTNDNKTVIIPNGAMANGNMTNFTMEKNRRVDFTIGIAYGDNYDTAKAMMLKFIEEDERILKTPAPFIGLIALADSSVNITLRVWGKTEDYWDIFFSMNERIYKEFGNEGINFPFPQMDVHIQQN